MPSSSPPCIPWHFPHLHEHLPSTAWACSTRHLERAAKSAPCLGRMPLGYQHLLATLPVIQWMATTPQPGYLPTLELQRQGAAIPRALTVGRGCARVGFMRPVTLSVWHHANNQPPPHNRVLLLKLGSVALLARHCTYLQAVASFDRAIAACCEHIRYHSSMQPRSAFIHHLNRPYAFACLSTFLCSISLGYTTPL